jgi:PAS domain S-box-containing protein
MTQSDFPSRILIVEDERAHAELIRRAFVDASEDFEIEVARRIEEAKSSITRRRPDVVITDLMLPDGKGTDLIPSRSSAGGAFPVVVMTSHGDESVAVEAMRAGAIDYVVKSEETFHTMPHVAGRASREWRQKRELSETRDALELMSQVFVDAADPILITDTYASIIDVNRAACELYGWSAEEEWLGRTIDAIVPDEERQRAESLYQRCLQGEEIRNVEMTQVGADGQEVTVLLTLSKLTDQSGSDAGIAAIAKDITERKRLEQEVRRAQKMEAIGTLTSGIAHDFNNLLMGINGCADIALSRLDQDHDSRPYVDEIKDAVTKGTGLTSQLLAFSRESGGEAEIIDFDAVVRDIERLLRPLLGEEVDFQVETGAEEACVEGDSSHLEQVLLNLVVNARDALDGRGQIRVETGVRQIEATRSVTSGELPEGDYVLLEVSDEGSGMDEETVEHIFEPFYTTKPMGEGTGLGLSTVYGIVNHCGGAVDVETELGVGTRFRVFVPRTRAESPEEPLEESEPVDGGGRRVLIIEDEQRVRLAVERYLTNGGYEVVGVEDADDAYQTCESSDSLDLILVDAALPSASGREVAGRCREIHPDVPVLFMSAYATDRLVREGLLHTGATVLQKPFSEGRLLRRIGSILGEIAEEEHQQQQVASDPRRLLLVEDNEIARMATAELLEVEGYETDQASSGQETMEAVERWDEPVDLALMDLTLPDIRGIELAGQLRQKFPGLPIVFLSGGTPSDPGVEEFLERERTEFLQKPVEIETLLRTIHDMIGQ